MLEQRGLVFGASITPAIVDSPSEPNVVSLSDALSVLNQFSAEGTQQHNNNKQNTTQHGTTQHKTL